MLGDEGRGERATTRFVKEVAVGVGTGATTRVFETLAVEKYLQSLNCGHQLPLGIRCTILISIYFKFGY